MVVVSIVVVQQVILLISRPGKPLIHVCLLDRRSDQSIMFGKSGGGSGSGGRGSGGSGGGSSKDHLTSASANLSSVASAAADAMSCIAGAYIPPRR